MSMSNKTYDILKWIAMYLLPAAGTLYFALAGIWGLPYGEQVVGTITAVDTCFYNRKRKFDCFQNGGNSGGRS